MSRQLHDTTIDGGEICESICKLLSHKQKAATNQVNLDRN